MNKVNKPQPEVTPELSRDLTLFHVTMMGLGMMIGAGVFIGIGNTLHEAGPGGLLLTFSLNGLVAFFTAMSFAELSSAIPRAGGAYNFARIAYGRGTSFVGGWMEWFASSVAGSLYAVVFATYTLDFFVQLGYLDPGFLPWGQKITALAIALLFIFINYRGTSETGKIGAFFTLGQMAFVLFIAVVGIITAALNPERIQNFTPFIHHDGWMNILVTMGFIYVAFEGFEVIAQAGDETIDPKRNIPKAMLLSVFIVTVTYVAVSFATVVAVSPTDPQLGGMEPWQWIGSFLDTGFGQAVSKLMPGKFLGFLLVSLAVIFSSTSALNATIYSATRASYALGRDGMLPPFFARISKKRKTPYGALTFTALILVTGALLLPTRDVASSASIMFLCLFFLVNLSAIKIRLDMGDELHYGYLMPLFPLFPILAILSQAVLVAFLHEMSMLAWIVAPIWISIGTALYFVYARHHAKATAEEVHVVEEHVSAYKGGFSIMLSIANPGNAEALVHQTDKLADAYRATVDLVHMVPVPSQTPLSDAPEYMQEGKEGILTVFDHLAHKYPVSSSIRYCRSIPRGIVSTVREKKVDMLVMGWHGERKEGSYRLGSTIDPIVDRSPSHVLIMKDLGDRTFNRVLVPLAGGPNAAMALEIASILVEDNGSIVAFTDGGSGQRFDIQRFVDDNAGRLHIPASQVQAKMVFQGDPVESILKEAEDYDLLVLGATNQGLIARMRHDTVPDIVAGRSPKSMVMVRTATGLKKLVRRWI
jgi:basic amino acid/polyamine antiporter, APA family